MSFEDQLLSGLPLAQAGHYFITLLGRDRPATAADLEKAAAALAPEERTRLAGKVANMMAMAPALPATAKGQNMPAPTPPVLPATAMGQNMKSAAAGDSPHVVGKERAHASLSAEFEKDKHHQREAGGGLVGKLLGGGAGAAVMHHYGKGNPLATLGGAALGEHLGGQAGKHFGGHADRRAYEAKAASVFKRALEEMGGAIEPTLDEATQTYLAAEQAAMGAQDANEAVFLRQQLDDARSKLQSAQAQQQLLEQQQQLHEQQIQDAQAQVQQATTQASGAQDQALAQTQAAAAMRMAYQQLRGQVLQLAAADPPALNSADAAMAAASTAAGPSSAPEPQAGPAGAAASPGTAPNSVAPEGDSTVSRPGDGQSANPVGTTSPSGVGDQMKEPADGGKAPEKEVLASLREALAPQLGALREALPYALGGAAIGAGGAALEGMGNSEGLRARVQGLEAKPDRGVSDTMGLAQGRARLTLADYAKEHPGAAIGAGALGGALLGGSQGPAIAASLGRAAGHAKNIGQNLKALVQ